MAETKIEWTATVRPDGTIAPGYTFNSWRGCTKVSPGCANCYAEAQSARNPKTLGVWGPKGVRAIAAEAYWKLPFKWNAEAEAMDEIRRVFCASLADVFEAQETMPAAAWPQVQQARVRLFHTIRQTPHLDWMLLTKRPEEIRPILRSLIELLTGQWQPLDALGVAAWLKRWLDGSPPANVWLGTSVESDAYRERISHLVCVPAVVRFLSCEPLLGPLDIEDWLFVDSSWCKTHRGAENRKRYGCNKAGLIHLVIAGGESGLKARPMNPEWARQLRDICAAAQVPFFFKQFGEWMPVHDAIDEGHCDRWDVIRDPRMPVFKADGTLPRPDEAAGPGCFMMAKVGKHKAGRRLDGQEWSQMPPSVAR